MHVRMYATILSPTMVPLHYHCSITVHLRQAHHARDECHCQSLTESVYQQDGVEPVRASNHTYNRQHVCTPARRAYSLSPPANLYRGARLQAPNEHILDSIGSHMHLVVYRAT